MKYGIISYLEYNGNSSDVDWAESDDFYAQYQIYLANPENYTLNQSSENYEIALKIYNSITSSFEHFNLTDNETAYLKFLIIYYLNNYGGNLSEYDNYSFEFSHIMLMAGCFNYNESADEFVGNNFSKFNDLNNIKTLIPSVNAESGIIVNQTNSTATNNATVTGGVEKEADNPFILFLILMMILAVFLVI